jgi:hypothetical protein
MPIDYADEEGEIGDGRHPFILHRQAELSVLSLFS